MNALPTPTRLRALRLALPLLAMQVTASAFQVNSGSDGSYGALNITANTNLTLPPDGILHCTTVNVAAGATLRFLRNDANTPAHLLATGDITIAGTIDVSGGAGGSIAGGEGGPGGWGGGNRALTGVEAGSGKGPGGGTTNVAYGGAGSYATIGNSGPWGNSGSRYGSFLLLPLLGGSGGAGGAGLDSSYGGGGGGGGAVLLASNTRIEVTGSVLAKGALGGSTNSNNRYNSGSGGAIRLVAPQLAVSGTLDVRGAGDPSAGGGDGYIRLDSGGLTNVGAFSLQGLVSRGRNPVIIPQNPPTLRLTHVAGNDIPLNQTAEVYLNLPPNGESVQPVTVRAEGFNSNVNVSVVLIPEYGNRVIVNGVIDNRIQNPASRTFNVNFPLDTLVSVHVWTQQTVKD